MILNWKAHLSVNHEMIQWFNLIIQWRIRSNDRWPQLTSMASLIYWKYISDNGDSRPDSVNSSPHTAGLAGWRACINHEDNHWIMSWDRLMRKWEIWSDWAGHRAGPPRRLIIASHETRAQREYLSFRGMIKKSGCWTLERVKKCFLSHFCVAGLRYFLVVELCQE